MNVTTPYSSITLLGSFIKVYLCYWNPFPAASEDARIVRVSVLLDPSNDSIPVLALMLKSPARTGRLIILAPLERHVGVAHDCLPQVIPAVVEVLRVPPRIRRAVSPPLGLALPLLALAQPAEQFIISIHRAVLLSDGNNVSSCGDPCSFLFLGGKNKNSGGMWGQERDDDGRLTTYKAMELMEHRRIGRVFRK